MRALLELWLLLLVYVHIGAGAEPSQHAAGHAARRMLQAPHRGAPDPSTHAATSSSTRVHAMEDTLYTAAGVLDTAAGLATAAAHSLECTDYTEPLESSVARQPSPWRPGQGMPLLRRCCALSVVTAEGRLTSGSTCVQESSGS